MKLVTEMDEIMAPKAMWNKCASPHIPLTGNGNGKERRQQGAAITVELILCVICKLAEEIEKATGKEEQFKVVKGRVIEKNLPSFQPISFHCSRKSEIVFFNITWPHLFKISIHKFSTVLQWTNWTVTTQFLSLLLWQKSRSLVLMQSVSWRQAEPAPLCCLYEWTEQEAWACDHVSISSPPLTAGADN